MTKFFKRKANRLCIAFAGYGFIPLADSNDDAPVFETALPEKIGDDAIIHAEGKRRKVRLLQSVSYVKNSTYLVDMGPA